MRQFLGEILLGSVQGALEWIPVSSEGVVVLIGIWSGLSYTEAISTALSLHLPSGVAALVRMRRELRLILRRNFSYYMLALMLTGIVAIFLRRYVILELGNNLNLFMGSSLIVLSVIYRTSRRKEFRELNDVSMWQFLLVGALQGLSVLPGVSRSGITVSALLLLGVRQEDSLKLSFCLGIPAMILAPLLFHGAGRVFTPLSFLSAFIISYLTMDFLLRISKKVNFWIFVLVFGILVIIGGMIP
ncbi:hypothetical protein B6U74_06750 [Candidatus Bathyarchaeota archaeon ex4484_205]|nr:MAG: hypothetical protein B6U74_06750 [Candidatus Bathyarchaeota archaeon ex4484_205]